LNNHLINAYFALIVCFILRSFYAIYKAFLAIILSEAIPLLQNTGQSERETPAQPAAPALAFGKRGELSRNLMGIFAGRASLPPRLPETPDRASAEWLRGRFAATAGL